MSSDSDSKRIIRVASLSGGRESTAMAITEMQEFGPDYYDEKIFANTGDDPMGKATVDHLNKYFGWNIIEVQVRDDNGNKVNIFDYYNNKIVDDEPEYTGHAIPNHQVKDCSGKFKIKPIMDYLKNKYGTEGVIFEMHIGYSHSEKEIGRMTIPKVSFVVNKYPLIERHYHRQKCGSICKKFLGFIPEKSQCDMCFERTIEDWKAFYKRNPKRVLEIIDFEESSKLFKKFGNGLNNKPIREILRLKKVENGQQTLMSCSCFKGMWDDQADYDKLREMAEKEQEAAIKIPLAVFPEGDNKSV